MAADKSAGERALAALLDPTAVLTTAAPGMSRGVAYAPGVVRAALARAIAPSGMVDVTSMFTLTARDLQRDAPDSAVAAAATAAAAAASAPPKSAESAANAGSAGDEEAGTLDGLLRQVSVPVRPSAAPASTVWAVVEDVRLPVRMGERKREKEREEEEEEEKKEATLHLDSLIRSPQCLHR